MSKPPDKTADVLDRAMRDALASVERIEHERNKPEDDTVPTETAAEGEGAAASVPSGGADALQTEADATREQLLRLAADFENYRKRSRREIEDVRRHGIERVLHDVLPVLDNLDRALSHAGDAGGPVIDGVRMVAKQFHDALVGHGVKPFDSQGQPFDPEKHEAVGREETDAYPPNTVVREMQRGYILHERLLRPARVMVAAAPRDKSS